MGATPGKPLGDIRAFVAKYRSYDTIGELPPIILATLRKRMIALAGEIADGMVFSGGSRAHMPRSLAALPAGKRDDPALFIGNRIRTCISDDIAEAKAVLRRTMTHYAYLPYYRNYWKEAGYTEEMTAIEHAIAEGRDVVGRKLARDLLAVARPQRDPVGFLPDDVPTSQLGVEGGELLDVPRVERYELEASCHSHPCIVGPPADNDDGSERLSCSMLPGSRRRG